MINLKTKNKNWGHLICGSFLIIISIIIFLIPFLYSKHIEKEEEILLEEFFEDNKNSVFDFEDNNIQILGDKEQYIAVLEIPKINLKRGVYDKTSEFNTVDKNIEILEDSDMPNINKGNFILAGHSGTGRLAFFNDLDKLDIDDEIIVYYQNIKYVYKIDNIYNVKKDGTIEIYKKDTNMITLTTCNQENKEEQLIITGILISQEKY